MYENPSTPRYISSNIPDSWWNDLAKMLNKGETIPYIGAGKSYTLKPTYTEAIHTAITADFPDNAKTITRIGLLIAWNYQENGGEFWGTGDYQRTPFRIYEGYSDEEGSFGFNHIVWKRMYSKTPATDDCSSFRGYLEDKHNVNLFHPKNSLMAFVAASADGCGSSRGLYWSYVKPDVAKGYASDIPEAERPKAYCYLDKDKATYCDRTVANKEHWKTYSATKVSGQELLGKAIIAYNRGANGFGERHYFSTTQMLKSDPNKKQLNRTFDYWMKIKEKTQTRAGITGYIPYVTYLWKGGLGFDVNKDGEVKDIIANPAAIPPVEAVIETTVPWCFLYGEKDWISPYTISEPDRPDRLASFDDYKSDATGDSDLMKECSL